MQPFFCALFWLNFQIRLAVLDNWIHSELDSMKKKTVLHSFSRKKTAIE